MSEREKDDGFVVGILVSLVLLLAVGLGMGGFMFARIARAREMEARMAAEQALIAQQQARSAEQQARTAAEALRAEAAEAVTNEDER
jgi:uncharacterized protein HemX